jgi:hypothetical protein
MPDVCVIDQYNVIDGLSPKTVWDDLRIEPVTRGTGTNAPTFTKWLDDVAGTSRGVYLYLFDNAATNSQKEVHFSIQMPHSWKGTAVYLHVHWIASSTAATSKVEWGLEYCFKDINSTYADTTIVYKDTDINSDTGTTKDKHVITSFDAIATDSNSDGISAILIGRLFRNSGGLNDSYTGDAGLLYIDAHFEIDALGSGSELTK